MAAAQAEIAGGGSAPQPGAPAPLVGPALAFAVGIALADGCELPAILVLGLVIVAALALALLGRGVLVASPRRSVVLLLAATAALGVGRHHTATFLPAEHIRHATSAEPVLTRIAGRVVSAPVVTPAVRRNPFLPIAPRPRTRFILAAERITAGSPALPTCGRLQVVVAGSPPALGLGDRVELTGRLYRPRRPRNPGETDWARWAELDGVHAGLSVGGAAYVRYVPGADDSAWTWLRGWREFARILLLDPADAVDLSDPPARLLETMLLGQRGAAGQELNDAFVRAGGMHFLAVSGFHVGVLVAVTVALARCLTRRRCVVAAVVVAVVVAYATVAEPRAPILRAALLGVVAALGLALQRPRAALNWLALAALMILAWNPLELFRAGFQFSFLLVFVLITLVPALQRALGRRLRSGEPPREYTSLAGLVLHWVVVLVTGTALTCVVAWGVSWPLTCYHFGRFSAYGIFGTFLLTWPVILCLWLGFGTLFFAALLPPLADVLRAALLWCTDLVLTLVGVFERLPAAVVDVPKPAGWLVLATYVLLMAGLLGWHTGWLGAAGRLPALRPWRWFAIVAMVALLAWPWTAWAGQRAAPGLVQLHVLAVGNGNATILECAGGQTVICDVGSDQNIDAGHIATRVLRELRVNRVHTIVISHGNFDHYAGLPTLVAGYRPECWFANPHFAMERDALRRLWNQLPDGMPAPRPLAAGDTLTLGRITVEVLWPPDIPHLGEWAGNDRSLVLRAHAAGRTILFTGDIERRALRGLLAEEAAGRLRLAADVLLAPHHGSVVPRDTAALLAAVQPEIIVVSTAQARLKFASLARSVLGDDCRIVQTAAAGMITVSIRKDGRLELAACCAREP